MAKNITELFQFTWHDEDGEKIPIHIKASNSAMHLFTASYGGGQISLPLSSDEMVQLGHFLIHTAEKIEKDPDFKKQ